MIASNQTRSWLSPPPQRIADARAEEARDEKEQAEAAAAAAAAGEGERGDADLVLYRRMAEVKRMEQMLAIEDLMYICILEKFQVGAAPGGWVLRRRLRWQWWRRNAACRRVGRLHLGAAAPWGAWLPGPAWRSRPGQGPCLPAPSLLRRPLRPPCSDALIPSATHRNTLLHAAAGDWGGHAAAGGAD